MFEPDIDRRAELILKGHLFEIGQVTDDHVGDRRGYHMTERGYAETLANVVDCGEVDQMDEVANWIKDQIETMGETPPNRRVRRHARKIVTEAEYPTNRYLNSV